MWSAKAIAALILLSTLGLPAHAGLIKYKDENGTLHVVQSVDDIPEKYREQAKVASPTGVQGTDPCIGKKTCGIFVVFPGKNNGTYRPWYKKLLAKNTPEKECGFKVVILARGSETKEDLEHAHKIYAELGPGAILDLKGETLSSYRIDYRMFEFVIDDKGRVLWTGVPAHNWAADNFGQRNPLLPPRPVSKTTCLEPEKTRYDEMQKIQGIPPREL